MCLRLLSPDDQIWMKCNTFRWKNLHSISLLTMHIDYRSKLARDRRAAKPTEPLWTNTAPAYIYMFHAWHFSFYLILQTFNLISLDVLPLITVSLKDCIYEWVKTKESMCLCCRWMTRQWKCLINFDNTNKTYVKLIAFDFALSFLA